MNKFGNMYAGVFVNVSFLPSGLIHFDKWLFHKINGEWHTPFFDAFFPLVREPFLWAPFYFFLALFVIINFRLRGWMWVLFLIGTAIISDYTSSSIIKDLFFRLRPCRDPELAQKIRFLVSYCPISSSFVSSHAVNHFAISTFIFVTFRNTISRKWIFIFLWAAMICYAQVYVGVHFPVDVICGSIIGIILGYIPSSIYNHVLGLQVQAKTLI